MIPPAGTGEPEPVEPAALAGLAAGGTANGGPVALCLDYDGTLVPIAPTADEARADKELRSLLAGLATLPRIRLAVVTGRTLESLDEALGEVPGIWRFGVHGGVGRTPAGEDIPGLFAPGSEASVRRLAAALEGVAWPPGVRLENKRLALGLHYRNASAHDAERALAVFRERAAAAAPGERLDLLSGKQILEARPRGLDKGRAVRWVLRRLAPARVIYVGDDVTDEDGFRAASGHGFGVLAAPEGRRSAARWRLAGPGEVRTFLSALGFKIRGDRR